MTKAVAVYSTMSTDVDYTFWGVHNAAAIALTQEFSIRINGKANIADKVLHTPRGAVTNVTDEEADLLESHPIFRQHLKNGFVAIEARNANIDQVLDDMVPRDESAPLEPGDLDDNGPSQLVSEEQQKAATQGQNDSATVVDTPKTTKRANTSKSTKAK